MNIGQRLDQSIRNIPDFPKPGIMFKDITPVLADPLLCHDLADALAEPFLDQKIDMVAGIESRGFIFGMLMAQRLNCGFMLIRKKGKLPSDTIELAYDLEYGEAIIEMHKDAFAPGQHILIHDDLLATGGTALAAAQLVASAGGVVAGCSFLIELVALGGAGRLQLITNNVVSILKYH